MPTGPCVPGCTRGRNRNNPNRACRINNCAGCSFCASTRQKAEPAVKFCTPPKTPKTEAAATGGREGDYATKLIAEALPPATPREVAELERRPVWRGD